MSASSEHPADRPQPERAERDEDFPIEGRLMALDYGTKRIGVAVSTPEWTIASPIETLTRTTDVRDAARLRQLAADYGIVGIVVGLPLHMGGEEGETARHAREFGRWAAEATELPVRFHDERLSTSIAEEHLLAADLSRKKRKARLDKLAAQILLQSFLEAARRRGSGR
ncbi:MAG: Holliday junction resolvase RuvX [Planctomycetes bacterium]|nr:Holliday junction resolvase RuvX [Planctomycetota bacterium]